MQKTEKRRRYNYEDVKKKQKQRIKLILAIIFLLFLILLINILHKQVVKPIIKAKDPLSILMVGSDINEYREKRQGGTKPEKTDSLMAVTFNPQTFKIVMTSIPRDTAVDYSCKDMRGKINEIYASNGKDIKCLVDSVANYLNIPIDYYVKVNMDQIIKIIEEVGGIEIVAHVKDGYLVQENVERDQVYEWIDGQTYKMGSDEALTYARARHDSEADYGRGIRQQQIVFSIVKSVLADGLSISDIESMLNIVDTNMPILLMKKYYSYTKELGYIYRSILKESIDETKIDSSITEAMMDYFNYKGNKPLFFDYLFKNKTSKEVKDYFIDSSQFYNERYNGYYITPYDQLKEISNKLRKNLNLKESEPNEMQKPFGVNKFPKERVVGKNSETTYTNKYTPNENLEKVENDTVTEDVSQNIEEPIEEIDSNTNTENKDDGTEEVDNNTEIDLGGSENINTDLDTDEDGLLDSEEEEIGTDPNNMDTDGDGLLDSEDEFPLDFNDSEGNLEDLNNDNTDI